MKKLLCLMFASVLLANSLLGSVVQAQIPGLPSLPNISLPAFPITLPQIPAFPSLQPIPALPQFAGNPNPPSDTSRPSEYQNTVGILSLVETRTEKITEAKPPFVEVIALEPSKTYQENRQKCRDDEYNKRPADPSKCPQFEWSVPYSLASESAEAARGLRKAWQRFEDRYYWRAMTELNNPAYYFMNCWINWGGGVNPKTPEVQIHVPYEGVPSEMQNKLDFPQENSNLRLDSYFPLPQVKNEDFCDDLAPAFLPFMYIPGFCFSVIGIQLFCTGDFPQPIWFNRSEAINRVTNAITRAHSKYLLEYQQDALAELVPGKRSYFFPFPWRTNLPGDGAIIAPVTDIASLDPKPFLDTATLAKDRLNDANVLAYFFQNVARSPTLDLLLLPGQNNVLYNPPGWWQAEEFKRLLPAANPLYQERFGYATFFQAWNQVDTLILPDADLLSRGLRSLVYWAVGLNIDCNFSGCTVVPIPAPVLVEPFALPFVGPRMHYGWVSVPEGYGIPRVTGTPLLDYRPILNTGGTP